MLVVVALTCSVSNALMLMPPFHSGRDTPSERLMSIIQVSPSTRGMRAGMNDAARPSGSITLAP